MRFIMFPIPLGYKRQLPETGELPQSNLLG